MKPFLLLFSFLVAPLFAETAAQPPMQMSEQSPRLVIHLLDYIGLDYPGAVGANGKILNQMEYQEQVEFTQTLLDLNSKLAETKSAAGIQDDLMTLKKLVLAKAPPEAVAKVARDVKWKVIGVSGVSLAPPVWPNLNHGKQKYQENCAQCHGATGHGDGPGGQMLDPKPADFHDASRVSLMTPFQAFNAIRLGVPGTAMASFSYLSEADVWDLAFYTLSLRFERLASAELASFRPVEINLQQLATQSDAEIEKLLTGTAEVKEKKLASLRLHTSTGDNSDSFVTIARDQLQESLRDYQAGLFDSAKRKALVAYLNGIEPIEPRIRANDSALFVEIEERMTAVRAGIDTRVSPDEMARKVGEALTTVAKVESTFLVKTSPTVSFSISMGIVLREAFEAILLIITLLGVIRSVGNKRAAFFVHLGWVLAVVTGLVFWSFSGWVMAMSGAKREILEGSVSLIAVGVVLYMGFWLHRRTEIGRWREFINDLMKTAMNGKFLFVLTGVSFMAVFREAFETVLFLRAVQLESGGGNQYAMVGGVVVALVIVVVLSVLLLRFSRKIPIRQLFDVSSLIMIGLAFILIGKAIHSFQEAGLVSITPFPLAVRWDLLGIYPSMETLIPQLLVLVTSIFLWVSGRRPTTQPNHA